MIRNIATICAVIVALSITGCLTTTGGHAKAVKGPAASPMPGGGRVPRLPGGPTPQMPSAPAPAMPAAVPHQSAQIPLPSPSAQMGPIAQVGYVQSDCRNCGDRGCNQGGCQSCLNSCQPPAPRGYLDCSPQGWNLYGVDPQEFICDGGDHPPDAYVRKDDSIAGLQPEDTVVHYTTEAGDLHIVPSNRECLYSPRFASVRKITAAVAGEKAIGLANVDRPMGPIKIGVKQGGQIVRDHLGPKRAEVAKRIDAMRDRNRGVPVEHVWQPLLAARVLPPLQSTSVLEWNELRADQLALVERLSQAAIAWTIGESVELAVQNVKPREVVRDRQVEAFTVYDFPEGRLRVLKLADKEHAQPGEVVTFTIRVENVGDAPVNEVVLTDNLITRLEYVADSQTSTAEAEFTATPNSEQSMRLKWKLAEPMKVGDAVTFEFQCLVR